MGLGGVAIAVSPYVIHPKTAVLGRAGGGKYKGILQQLMMERDYAFQRQIRYYVNVDIDKIMRKLS